MCIEDVCTAVKYRNYRQAIFLLNHCVGKNKTLRMVLGILHYENKEYYRALCILEDIKTSTAQFYVALCHKEMKNYGPAINLLLSVIGGELGKDERCDVFDHFILPDKNVEHLYALLGELYILNEEAENGLFCYKKCMDQFHPFITLFYERAFMVNGTSAKKETFFSEFQADLIKFEKTGCPSILQKYYSLVPGIGSYFVSNAARILFEQGEIKKSIRCFDCVIKADPSYVYNFDYYSASLWLEKNTNLLSCLCRNLLENWKGHHITWIALGNYFSLKNDHNRSIVCFKKSLSLYKTAYAYLLIGHEYILKSEYEQAQKHFFHSLKLHTNNYNALFGIGIVFSKTDRAENADVFFRKSILLNSRNKIIRYLYVKYLVEGKKYEKALDQIKQIYKVTTTDMKIAIMSIKKSLSIERDDYDDLVILEMIDILIYFEMISEARMFLDIVNVRNAVFKDKRDMIDKILMTRENKTLIGKK